MKTLLVVFLLSLPLLSQTNPPLDPPAAAVAGITAERMRTHMSFLADDLLEGRGTGTRGHEIAARYVQTQFELLGLKPAGVNGYRQQVPFRSITVVPEQSSVVMKRNGKSTPLKIYEDVLLGGNETSTDVSVEAPAVFVGYGVSAPHLHYDDYANADVRGKIAVIMYGAPPSFPSSERAHFSNRRVRREYVGTLRLWSDGLGRTVMVRERGLEPPPLAGPDPKSGVSAISPLAQSYELTTYNQCE